MNDTIKPTGRLVLPAIALLLATGCTTCPHVPSRVASDAMIAGIAADVATTIEGVDNRGCRELNPLYGDVSRPYGLARLLSFNAALAGLAWLARDQDWATIPMLVHGGYRFSLAVHNVGVNCGGEK